MDVSLYSGYGREELGPTEYWKNWILSCRLHWWFTVSSEPVFSSTAKVDQGNLVIEALSSESPLKDSLGSVVRHSSGSVSISRTMSRGKLSELTRCEFTPSTEPSLRRFCRQFRDLVNSGSVTLRFLGQDNAWKHGWLDWVTKTFNTNNKRRCFKPH